MTDICFVFPSAAERDAKKIIDKYLKNVEYDVKFLSSGTKEKILKKIGIDFAFSCGLKFMCTI